MDSIERFKTDVKGAGEGRVVARLHEIADSTGIPFKTLSKLYYGPTAGMRYPAMVKLEAFLRQLDGAAH